MKTFSFDKKYNGLLFSAYFSVCLFLYVVFMPTVRYLTNDDFSIQNALSGKMLGYPYPFHQFISPLLGVCISSLYKLFPTINFWLYIQISLICMSNFLVIFCLFEHYYYRARELEKCVDKDSIFIKNKLKIETILLYLILFLFFIFPHLNKISFTTTASIVGGGVFIFDLFSLSNDKTNSFFLLINVVTLLIVSLYRIQLGYVFAILYFTLDTIYLIKKQENINKIRILKHFAIFLSVILLVKVSNLYFLYKINGKSFVELNKLRFLLLDYNYINDISNNDIFDIFDIKLIKSWTFLSNKFNLESIKSLSYERLLRVNFLNNIQKFFKTDNLYFIHSNFLVLISIFMSLAIFILQYIMLEKTNILYLIFNMIFFLLFVYLIVKGRHVYRGFHVVYFCWFAFNIFYIFTNEFNHFLIYIILTFLLYVLCLVISINLNVEKDDNINTNIVSLYEYCNKNENNIYIYNVVYVQPNIDVKDMNYNYPKNFIPVGGSIVGSKLYDSILQNNNLNGIYPETFYRSDVYYVSNNLIENNTIFYDIHKKHSDQVLYYVLSRDVGINDVKVITKVGDYYIYKFYKK